MPALRRRTVFNVERNWFGSSRFFNKLSQARTRLCQTLDRDLGIRTVFVHVHNSTQPFASELHYGFDIGAEALQAFTSRSRRVLSVAPEAGLQFCIRWTSQGPSQIGSTIGKPPAQPLRQVPGGDFLCGQHMPAKSYPQQGLHVLLIHPRRTSC